MTTVTKTITFDAAHILTNHGGLCKNLHGHTYRVDVSVAQSADAAADMVIDFKDLKTILEDVVSAHFDHAFIYSAANPDECEIAALIARKGMRTVALPYRSTAENLARHFFEKLSPRIAGLAAVRVWETPGNCAEYRP